MDAALEKYLHDWLTSLHLWGGIKSELVSYLKPVDESKDYIEQPWEAALPCSHSSVPEFCHDLPCARVQIPRADVFSHLNFQSRSEQE